MKPLHKKVKLSHAHYGRKNTNVMIATYLKGTSTIH